VQQVVTQGGTTTTTVYVGGVEEVATSGGTTTTTLYYYAGGTRIGLSVNGTKSYLAADGLGSATVTLSSGGTATAGRLYAPYGGVRYSSGTMPTSYGFTGQREDAMSGLDYYGARYYDSLAGQFTSGDNVLPGGGFDVLGLSRYAYVEGNPIARIDPSGNRPMLGPGTECSPRGCDVGFIDSTTGECLGTGCGGGSPAGTYIGCRFKKGAAPLQGHRRPVGGRRLEGSDGLRAALRGPNGGPCDGRLRA
jgi:RHS repeat-associated protein